MKIFDRAKILKVDYATCIQLKTHQVIRQFLKQN